jgi:hypothetical protein
MAKEIAIDSGAGKDWKNICAADATKIRARNLPKVWPKFAIENMPVGE